MIAQQLFENILVVHLGPVGNWILATGAFRDLRETFPSSRIVLFTRDSLSTLARRTGCFDEVLSTAWTNSWRHCLRHPESIVEGIFFKPFWRWRLGKHDFGLAVNLHGGRHLFDLVSPLAKVALPLSGRPDAHIVDWYRSSIEAIGVPARHEPSLPAATACPDGLDGVDYAVLIPCSEQAAHGKNWDPARFLEIGRRLKQNGVRPIIIGAPGHRRRLKPLTGEPGFLSLVGKTSLDQLIELFSFARLVVGVDTGTLHMANALAVPSVGLYGPTRMSMWRPRGTHVVAVKKARMDEIGVDEVWMACQGLLPSLSDQS